MLLSATDFADFAEATGTEYPTSAAQKAALTPVVLDWKADQQQQQAQARGPNSLGIGLGVLGAAGLGAAGLAAFNHFRRSGLAEETAAQLAREAEVSTPSPCAQARKAGHVRAA